MTGSGVVREKGQICKKTSSSLGRSLTPWYHLNSQANARALSSPVTGGTVAPYWKFKGAAHERLSPGPSRELTPAAPSLGLRDRFTYPVIAVFAI